MLSPAHCFLGLPASRHDRPHDKPDGRRSQRGEWPERDDKQTPAVRSETSTRDKEVDAKVGGKLDEVDPLGVLFQARRGGHVEDAWHRRDALVEAYEGFDFGAHACPHPQLADAVRLDAQRFERFHKALAPSDHHADACSSDHAEEDGGEQDGDPQRHIAAVAATSIRLVEPLRVGVRAVADLTSWTDISCSAVAVAIFACIDAAKTRAPIS
mmetsp:Transcript_86852/g.260883  ORF Transcript_86852/g.260883 Transcript_86852/m.260883 type:complete len:212 (-) Transcript_86852:407-1042(-)